MILVPIYKKFVMEKVLLCALGMDSKCGYTLGGVIDGIAIWITSDTCLCTRQALALLIPTYVGSFVNDFAYVFFYLKD